MSIDLNDLDLNVDISVADPEEYADNARPTFPMGTHTFAITNFDLDRDQDGKPKLTKSGLPIVLLKSLKAVDGDAAGRFLGFQRIYTTTYTRKNREGKEVKVSQLGDLIRALDKTAPTTTVQDAMNFLERARDMGLTFKAKVNWEAFDKDYYDQLCRDRGITDSYSPEAKQARKEATLSGKKGFPEGPTAIGPSGKTLTAQARLSDFYPSRD
jgi:hypothetical protein